MLKPSNDKYKPPVRPFEVITILQPKMGRRKLLKRYLVIATSANLAIEALTLEGNEVDVEAKELVDYELVIAK